ncbi:glucose 1-dehydrogenase [Caulobacter sp. KR2-114]|uniref:glucose 1-dehydrogenase n=1 Tax=Caulobacter sp. KR2-114 TaxID=3400912 RepID=UPI003BFF5C51
MSSSSDPLNDAPLDDERRGDIAYQPVLPGQVALVTGANSGIGRAVALGLAQAGADVAVNFLDRPEDARAVVEAIRGYGRRAIAVQADVSDEAQVDAMFAQVTATFGALHIAVANAGLQDDCAFEAMSLGQWNKVIAVNLTGQFLCARAAIRQFDQQGPDPGVSLATGKVICMSSVHQEIPWAGHANYAASKGGVMMLMRSIAQEVAPRRIRVNGIAPGAIRTGINTKAWDTPQAYADLMAHVPYKRIGEPDDVARAAVWLASDASDYVTGTTLFVDGGMTLYPGFATGG